MGNKGTALEQLIGAIQEVLKDRPDITVSKNVFLTNVTGNKREFDVVVRAHFQGIPSMMVFECKDYNKKVGALTVNSFHGKCALFPDITQKVMVSTMGFTEGAYKEAAAVGIQLYHIKEMPLTNILITGMAMCIEPSFNYFLSRCDIYPNMSVDRTTIVLNLHEFYTKDGEPISYQEMFALGVKNTSTKEQNDWFFAYQQSCPKPIVIKFTYTPEEAYIKDMNGYFHKVCIIEYQSLVTFKIEYGTPITQKAYQQGTQDIVAVEYAFQDAPEKTVVIKAADKQTYWIKDKDDKYHPFEHQGATAPQFIES